MWESITLSYRATRESGINSIFSYRGLGAISRLKSCLPLPEVLKICLIKEMTEDDLRTLQSSIKCSSNNKYFNAFKSL